MVKTKLGRFLAASSHIRFGRLLLLLALVTAVLIPLVWAAALSPAQWWGEAEVQRINIAPGATARTISQQLHAAKLIRSSGAFRLLGRLTGTSGSMKAGVYDISPKEGTLAILRRLNSGDDVDLSVKVTIPEGFTVKKIAHALEAAGILPAKDFLEYLKTAPLPYDFLEQQLSRVDRERRFEGLLFPDSYHLLPGSTAADVVDVMTRRWRQVVESVFPAEVLQGGQTKDTPVPMNLTQLLTLASIIEREAVVDEERAVISGVFYNRLEIDQALQSCATVQYILEKSKPILSTADTQIDSPYNTYRNPGLTPGPIATSGLPSLRAAAQPAATEYFYFFAKPDDSGQHVFSRTFAEHDRAIDQWYK